MNRRRSPLRALFTVLAFIVSTIARDRVSASGHRAPIVENRATSTAAIPTVWSFAVEAHHRPGSPNASHGPQHWIASYPANAGESATSQREAETLGLRERDPHAFTYDATAPPSIVVA